MADAMDSKSILRKGVGVRLPSLAPEPTPAQRLEEERRARERRALAAELAAPLWASLSARLRAARGELEATLALLRQDRARALADERGLARGEALREHVRRAGWCLGVLGAALGVDFVRARRERDGLRWLVGAVAEARGLALSPTADELPQLSAGAPADFEPALLAAWCALQADAGAGCVRWRAAPAASGTGLEFELGARAERAELAERCARVSSAQLAGPRLVHAAGRLVLSWS